MAYGIKRYDEGGDVGEAEAAKNYEEMMGKDPTVFFPKIPVITDEMHNAAVEEGRINNAGDNADDTIDTTGDGSGGSWVDQLLNRYKDPKGGTDINKAIKDLGALGLSIAGLKSAFEGPKQSNVGYQGGIPSYVFNRAQIAAPAGGNHGRNYTSANFTGGSFSTPDKAAGIQAALKAKAEAEAQLAAGVPAVSLPQKLAEGGEIDGQGFDAGIFGSGNEMAVGYARGGPTHYLQGNTDGMADQVPATIDGKQPARLAHGEFVWPADVVSHLGNGNSDAGAKKLYQAMAAIRKARTGNPKQGKEINPDKFLPGLKSRGTASGGITDAVPRFYIGGATTTGMAPAPAPAPAPPSIESSLSNWAGPYVTDMLGKGKAVSEDMIANPTNYVYQGDRVAGPSALQTQAFTGAGNLGVNANLTGAADTAASISNQARGMKYDPTAAQDATKFTGNDFTGNQVSKYMNPYLQQSLDPQLAEARRQAEIQRMTNAKRLVGSGAFGGGRQAVMEAEGDRNLLDNIASITGKGYDTAFAGARDQFNQSQAQSLQRQQAEEASRQFEATKAEGSKQFGAKYGLDALDAALRGATTAGNLGAQVGNEQRANVNTQLNAGNVQQGIDQAGLAADMQKFNEEAALPGQAIKFQQGLLQGLPIQAQSVVQPELTLEQKIAALLKGGSGIKDVLTGA
jgi:hypothetical protein